MQVLFRVSYWINFWKKIKNNYIYSKSPTSDGSAAAIVCSERFVKANKLENKAIEILALEMATDLPSTFKENDCMKIVGYDMSQLAAKKAFTKSGIKPEDVQVIELHDCFSCNELITYEGKYNRLLI